MKLRTFTVPFGVTPRALLDDKEISLKAKGLFAFIQSKPDGWKFSERKLASLLAEGESSIAAALQELEKFGWLKRKKYKDAKGHWDIEYILCENPDLENPDLENPGLENPGLENPGLENHPNNSNKEGSNKDIKYLHTLSNKERQNKNIDGWFSQIGKNLALTNKLDTQKADMVYRLGEFGNVKITQEEKDKLSAKLGEQNTEILIEELSGYLAATPKKYASHYAVILNWARRRVIRHQEKSEKPRSIAFAPQNHDL